MKDLIPTNHLEQMELFFESDCTVNPQFEYENYEAAKRMLS